MLEDAEGAGKDLGLTKETQQLDRMQVNCNEKYRSGYGFTICLDDIIDRKSVV